MVDVENAVEMICLVFNGLRENAVRFQPQLLARQVLVAESDAHRAVHHAPVSRQTQTALLDFALALTSDNLGVHQDQGFFPVLGLDHAHALQHADLVGSQPDAPFGLHGLNHVGGQLRQLAVEPRNLDGPLTNGSDREIFLLPIWPQQHSECGNGRRRQVAKFVTKSVKL